MCIRDRIWIDYNQDGQFDDNTELAYKSGTGEINGVTGQITIPGNAVPGNTRMRVAMKAAQSNTTPSPTPCETIDFGEVEDYCVNIVSGNFNCVPPAISSSSATTSAIQLDLTDIESATIYVVQYRPIGTNIWEEQLFDTETDVAINNLTTCLTYDIQVATMCADGSTSSFSTLTNIATICDCSAPSNLTVTPIETTGFELQWSGVGTSYEIFLGATDLSVTRTWTVDENRLVVNDLPTCTDFDVNITAFCQSERGSFIEERISSPCATSIATLPLEINTFQVAPNPFREVLNLQLDLTESTPIRVSLHHINGQTVWQQNMGSLPAGRQNQNLNIPNLVGGIYLVRVVTASGSAVQKVVKVE